jgi:hypothetical protein
MQQRSSTGPTDPIGDMFDALEVLLAPRPNLTRVPVIRDDVDATLRTVVEAIAASGMSW